MNKRYEEGRKPFFSSNGETKRRQFCWAKDEKGENKLVETEPIDIQAEIESYADECDIKNIVRRASFDPEFLESLSQGAMDGTELDITEWPQNIHEYHQMIATAQMKLANLAAEKKAAEQEALEKKALEQEALEQEGEIKNESE